MPREHKGVFVPIITPMTDGYQLDRQALRQHVEFLVESKVHGLVPCGSTGEFARLSEQERMKVAEWTVDAAGGRTAVLVGTASASTDMSVRLSKHAENIGAQGLQVSAPFYGKPSEDELFNHYKTISESVEIPIFVYNNPWTTGTDILPKMMKRLSELHNVRYVKEASGDIRRVSQIIRLTEGRLTVFAGSDDTMFESFLVGAKGWVSGTANFAPEQSLRLFKLCVEKRKFDEAMDLYERIIPIGELLEGSGKFVQYIKAAVELIGLRAGPPRRPQLPISDEERAQLQALMGALGVETKARARQTRR